MVYVSESLRGEPVGLVQQDERTWTIHFGQLLIGLPLKVPMSIPANCYPCARSYSEGDSFRPPHPSILPRGEHGPRNTRVGYVVAGVTRPA